MERCVIPSPIGGIELKGDQHGLASLKVVNKPPTENSLVPEVLFTAMSQLQSYFNKQVHDFNIQLNLQGTTFERAVWEALRKIPYGKTISYKELATDLGNPSAVRAVAKANAKNPVWINVPCHRVIGVDGTLRGYAGGLHRKKWLLRHEGAIRQQSLF
jgi:methylated-DNA-[protein]-cysteine S-methyltransferase